MSILESLYGSGGAPLVASRNYSFNRATASSGAPALWISVVDRDSRDDFGTIEYAEQEEFVEKLIKSLGVAVRGGYPGEWIFADSSEQELVWLGLSEAIQPPAKTVPSVTAQRAVDEKEAGAVSAALTARFLALVDAVLGRSGGPFVCRESRVDNNGYEATRLERWQRDGASVRVEATGIESGHGVHGETATYTLADRGSDPRSVSAYARIDMRSGGVVSVTVQGVHGAQALADEFVRAPA